MASLLLAYDRAMIPDQVGDERSDLTAELAESLGPTNLFRRIRPQQSADR